MDQVYLRLLGGTVSVITCKLSAAFKASGGTTVILCGNNSSICMHNTILGLCKGTDRQHKKQTCENKFIYSPHSFNPAGILEITITPAVADTHICAFLLLNDPVMQQALRVSEIRQSTSKPDSHPIYLPYAGPLWLSVLQ